MGLCQFLVRRTLRDGDSPEEQRRKGYWVPLMVVVTLYSFVAMVVNLGSIWQAGFIAGVLCFVITLVCLIWPFATRTLPLHLVGGALLLLSLCCMLWDVEYSARMSLWRPWTYIVLAMDMYLAFNVHKAYQYSVLGITSLFLVFLNIENSYRLGAYDTSLTESASAVALERCSCAVPPCATEGGSGADSGVSNVINMLVVLLGDFAATRNFADGLRSEQAKMVASVRLSERVAQLLAAYATEDARCVVAEEGAALPAALLDSYERLLGNLDSYRAYLPDLLLIPRDEVQDAFSPRSGVLRPAPGAGEEMAQVAVCFTDIQSSTELWQVHPQGMYEALQMHNKVMRDTYAACNGYEVKTIGDSFMVAFEGGPAALRFGLEVQLGLLRQKWPEELLTHPLCERIAGASGEPLWGGLRVRIGIEAGVVRIERNPVTARCDYFGHTVNTAARLEAVLRKGGLVATSDTVLDALGEEGALALGSPAVYDAGFRELKGIMHPVQVWALAPLVLKERIDLVALRSPISSPRRSIGVASDALDLSSSGDSFGQSDQPCTPQVVPLCNPMSPHVLHLPLQRTAATYAVARLSLQHSHPVAETVGPFATTVAVAADQAQGVVDTLLSACVFVSWNASRPCVDHTAACIKFLSTNLRLRCHLGATSGVVLNGSLNAGRRSFATVVGGCVELAAALAEEAERCGDAVLAAGTVADRCAAVHAAFCAQLWVAPGGLPVRVWTIDKAQLRDVWLLNREAEHQRDEMWADAVSVFFSKICAEAPGSDRQRELLAELGDGFSKQVRERLAARVSAGLVRTRLMPALWNAADPSDFVSPVSRNSLSYRSTPTVAPDPPPVLLNLGLART